MRGGDSAWAGGVRAWVHEEETGRISGSNVSHPDLFVRFGEGVGVPRHSMVDGVPLPTTAALIGWFAASTRERPFIEGAAATNLAAEGQVPGAFCPLARALERHYGCTREQVAFWDVHEHAESESTARSVITSSLAWRPRRRSKPTCAGPSVARSSSGGGSSRDRHRRPRLLNAARLLAHQHAARGRPL